MRFAACVAGLMALVRAQPQAPTVATDCGPVSGTVDFARTTNAPAYRYSSIPFAAPPLGALRWRPPAARACPWSGTLNGSALPDVCVQDGGTRGREDCLYLHVVTPATAPPPGGWPVLVYFHGGNLISGGTPGMLGPSAVMATEVAGGAVVVAVAYRLNTLGWLADASFDMEARAGVAGNFGALDAIAGLQWVRGNVAAFGGRPDDVTIFGQSSGGTLIFTLLAMPAADGLFSAAYSMSGSPNITMSHARKLAQDAPIVSALNCGAQPAGPARAACLRALPAGMVGAAMPSSWGTPGIFGWLPAGIPAPAAGGMAYAAIMHVDGAAVTLPLLDALLNQTVDCSVVISNMEAECDGGPGVVLRNATAAQYAAAEAAAFRAWPGGGAAEAAAVQAAYAAEAAVDPQLAYDAISADYGLTCAGRALGRALLAGRARRTRPVYLLYNALQASPAQWSPSGAGRWPKHGLDLDLLGRGWPAPPTADDLAEAALMQRFLGDLATSRGGALPAAWAWPPVAGPDAPADGALYTMVFALPGGFPGGGTRAVEDFKAAQCAALGELAAQEYWWVD